MLVIICAKYGRNPSRIVDFFFKVKAEKFKKFAKIFDYDLWPLLLTWFNFNPSMDK